MKSPWIRQLPSMQPISPVDSTSARKEDKNIALQTETHDVVLKKYPRINKKTKITVTNWPKQFTMA